jgi:hypothetical protein
MGASNPETALIGKLAGVECDPMPETCAICGCELHRRPNTYARPTIEGRSHATSHHFIAERFFGRSITRRGTQTDGVFTSCPWGHEGESAVFCYECHEELLHNPVLLPEGIARFAELVRTRGLSEQVKTEARSKLAGRVVLFHDVITRGLRILHEEDTNVSKARAEERARGGLKSFGAA